MAASATVSRVQELLRPRRPAPIRAKPDDTQAGAPGAPVRIRFDVLDEEVVERMAVCEVESRRYIDDGGVTSGGVYDPRMGPLRHSDLCVTCGADMERCEGHPGLIRLACPVYHPLFLPLLLRVLRATCYRCASPLVGRQASVRSDILAATALENRLRVATKNPPSQCPVCESPQTRVKILKNGNYGLGERTRDGTFVSLRPDAVRDRLRGITAATRDWLGIGFDPLNLVMTRLLVPPSAVRIPVVQADGNIKGHDDLTTLLISVLRANATVARNVDRPSHILNPLWADLQKTVCCYLNNSPSEKAGYRGTRRNGSPMKGVSDRLTGKAGRMRGDLMGRRVDFSARTVITPDPSLDVDEVGVPASIARKVTVREAVTALNLRELQACVLVGPHAEHGTTGAALVERGGLVLDLQREHPAAALCLRVGDAVHRHLRDGDIVVMNRQPTLHAASMMAHRVRVLPYSTFRLNLSVTTPYNADFDGDEMNMHVPQSYAARAEIWELARVAAMIVTPDRGHPCMAFVQDALLAAGVLTGGGVFIERALFYDCLLALGDAWDGVVPRPAVARPRPLWTGAQLWSAAMRAFPISLQRGTWRADTDLSARPGDLLVREGELLVGRLTKGLLGQAPGSIVHEVWHRHGPDATARFLSAAQRPLNLWLEARGFTVGVADCVTADPTAPAQIEARLEEGLDAAAGLQEQVLRGRLEPDVGLTPRETFEGRIRAILERTSADVRKLVRAGLSPRNNINAIVTIGSKGSPLNLQQITGCLGQQILMQGRMPAWFRGRTLPAFRRSDVGAIAGGFVRRSFIGGLDPIAFWFHAEASREGLIDTAIKTADSGYAQRKAIKTIEDDTVAANGLVIGRSVDTTSGRSLPAVLQFTYGLDGFDGGARELQAVDALTMSPERIRDLHGLPACLAPLLRDERLLDQALANPYGMAAYLRGVPLEASLLTDLLVDLATAAVATERWVDRILADRAAVLEDLRAADTDLADAARRPMPFNLDRILAEAARTYGLGPTAAATLSPLAGNDMIDAWLAGLDVADPRMLGLWVRSRLGGWRGPCQHGLTREALAFVLETAGALLGRAAVEPGAPVGTLAGQSLGEPLTQMTLNTFHQAGVGHAPPAVRVRELLDQAGTKKPIMRVRFEPGATEADVVACAFGIQEMRLRDVAAAASVEYTPADNLPGWLEVYVDVEGFDATAFSPLHLEVRLSEASLGRYMATCDDVVELVRAALPDTPVFGECVDGVFLFRTFRPPGEVAIADAVMALRSLMGRTLAGVPGVTRAIINREIAGRETVLLTEGTNLRGLRTWALSHPAGSAVDLLRSDCNDPAAVAAELGIEAATACNAAEFNAVYWQAMSFVDPKHISVVADHIAWTGTLLGCTSNSIVHTPASVLACASFERTKSFFSAAAAAGRTEPIDDTASRIIFSMRVRAGTGGINLRLDAGALDDVAEPVAPAPALPAPQAAPPAQRGDYIPADAPMSPSPADVLFASPAWGASPLAAEAASPAWAPRSPVSPAWAPASPDWAPPPKRQRLAPYSPSSPTSALLGAPYSPTSPIDYSPTSPTAYSPSSPTVYSPASPTLMETSGDVPYSPTSPMHLGQAQRTVGRSHRAHGAASAHAYAGATQAPFAKFSGASPASPVWIEALAGQGRQP